MSKDKLERAKTIGGKDGIYHEKRTGMNCWIPHAHSETSKAIGDRVAELIGFPFEMQNHIKLFTTQVELNITIIMMLLITKLKKEESTLQEGAKEYIQL